MEVPQINPVDYNTLLLRHFLLVASWANNHWSVGITLA